MAKPKLVVKTHQPKRLGLIWGAAVCSAILMAYLMYEYGRYRGGYDGRAAKQMEQDLSRQVREYTIANDELREKIALLQTSEEVDREAYYTVESTLGDLQDQIQSQKEELAFYRAIVAPEDGKRGLRIQEFKLTPGNADDEFRLRLVLVQAAAKHDRRVSGTVKVMVEGARDGARASYDISELISANDNNANIGFSFRYFQNFERQLILPSGFVPQRVNVEVSPKGRVADVIKRSFDWSVKSS